MPLTLELERALPADRPTAFAAFTNSEALAQWWGPEGFSIPSLEWRPRVGEYYRIEMQPPEGGSFHLTGQFHELEPPERLAFTFVWEEPDPDDLETLARLSFRDAGESTELTLSQGDFKTDARRELHRDGWSDTLDKLERYLASGD
jgi:uncharacterized protein YndB with AHSA1/START domain